MKVELSCSTQTAACNYSSLPGFSLPVSYLPAAARGCIETESEGGEEKGMDRRKGRKEAKACVCVCVLGLAGEFHWRGA